MHDLAASASNERSRKAKISFFFSPLMVEKFVYPKRSLLCEPFVDQIDNISNLLIESQNHPAPYLKRKYKKWQQPNVSVSTVSSPNDVFGQKFYGYDIQPDVYGVDVFGDKYDASANSNSTNGMGANVGANNMGANSMGANVNVGANNMGTNIGTNIGTMGTTGTMGANIGTMGTNIRNGSSGNTSIGGPVGANTAVGTRAGVWDNGQYGYGFTNFNKDLGAEQPEIKFDFNKSLNDSIWGKGQSVWG